MAKLTLEDKPTHSDRIIDIPLPLQHIHQISYCQVISSIGILCENLLEFRQNVFSLGVIRPSIATMSRSMHVLQEKTEEGIWKPS
jgi:hypothetical protein